MRTAAIDFALQEIRNIQVTPYSECLSELPISGRLSSSGGRQQESPAIADKPARRESLPKIAPIRRAYNVIADNTGLSSFV